MADIDIVIVNYRSSAHTVNCVRSIHDVAKMDDVTVTVTVINNGDEDMDFENKLQMVGPATVIDNLRNRGFGAACNQGAEHGTADIILFLNPDAALKSGALSACLGYFRHSGNEQVGILGPEITDAHGELVPSCSRTPRFNDLLLRSVGLHGFLSNKDYPYLPLDAHRASRDVGQVMGAALFIRRALFQQLGGFDERLFMYYEDVDLCARAEAGEFRCRYLKEAGVMHIGRASSSSDKGMALALHIRSRLIYTGIHHGRSAQIVLALVCLVIELPVRFVSGFLRKDTLGGLSALKAYGLLVGNAMPGANR